MFCQNPTVTMSTSLLTAAQLEAPPSEAFEVAPRARIDRDLADDVGSGLGVEVVDGGAAAQEAVAGIGPVHDQTVECATIADGAGAGEHLLGRFLNCHN